jgi:hypothetical protein
MSNNLTKRPGPTAAGPVEDAASRLKHGLMADALGRMLGKDNEKPIAPGNPRVLLALANHGRSPGWRRAKTLQLQMFEAAAGSGLEMKFAFYAEDDDTSTLKMTIKACAVAGLQRIGSPIPMTWHRSWIEPNAAVAVTSIFAA